MTFKSCVLLNIFNLCLKRTHASQLLHLSLLYLKWLTSSNSSDPISKACFLAILTLKSCNLHDGCKLKKTTVIHSYVVHLCLYVSYTYQGKKRLSSERSISMSCMFVNRSATSRCLQAWLSRRTNPRRQDYCLTRSQLY